jgi:hypothetical protein
VRRIRPGMTLAQVEAILGRWPRYADLPPMLSPDKEFYWCDRYGAEGEVQVCFSPEMVVEFALWRPRGPVQPGPLARLRAWLAGLAGNLPHDAGNLK